LEPPYVIKPNAAGSSVGVHIIRPGTNRPPTELSSREYAFGDEVLVEEFIPGKELSVAVLGNRALTVTEIIPSTDYYDYEAKYSEGGSRHEVPAKIDAKAFEAAKKAAEEAHRALGCRGVTRTDFRFDPERGRLVLLEINTQPGMTPTSLAPEQAAHAGMPYDALVQWMLEDASWPR
jgi:D-alanine-D-alanine ligase